MLWVDNLFTDYFFQSLANFNLSHFYSAIIKNIFENISNNLLFLIRSRWRTDKLEEFDVVSILLRPTTRRANIHGLLLRGVVGESFEFFTTRFFLFLDFSEITSRENAFLFFFHAFSK